jgi:BASS family bile acid:Na+ symporter
MKVLAGCFVEIDAVKMMYQILQVVIFPMVGGAIVHRLLRRVFETHKVLLEKVLSIISMAGICYTILALTAPSRDTFASAGVVIILAAILHNSIGYFSGYFLTRLAGRFLRLGESEARTVAIEVGMQNGGMAGALAISVLGSAIAALPANVFSIWMNFSGSVLASWWSSRPVRSTGNGEITK